MALTKAQEFVEAARPMGRQLTSERLTSVEPASELNQLLADQGQAMRAMLIDCTAAIVAALEGR